MTFNGPESDDDDDDDDDEDGEGDEEEDDDDEDDIDEEDDDSEDYEYENEVDRCFMEVRDVEHGNGLVRKNQKSLLNLKINCILFCILLQPGSESGCTALVALIKNNKLYVANAGDCRCVVSKNGEAIEMSLDHKPENDIELQRIEKAGGSVTAGRVNAGLNLSRALGELVTKINS